MISLYLQTDILGGIPEDTTGVHRITQPLGTPRVLQTTTGLATRDNNRGRYSRSNNAAPRHTLRLAINDGVGRPGTDADADKEHEPGA